MIDHDVYGNDIRHRLTVARLRELISDLRDDDELWPNDLLNLAITRAGEYIGYLDFKPPGEVDLDWGEETRQTGQDG